MVKIKVAQTKMRDHLEQVVRDDESSIDFINAWKTASDSQHVMARTWRIWTTHEPPFHHACTSFVSGMNGETVIIIWSLAFE